MPHFSPHASGIVSLQFCYQFYAFVLVVALFGGFSILALALMTLYGVGGLKLVCTLFGGWLFILVRTLFPPWHERRVYDQSEKKRKTIKRALAIETLTLKEKEESVGFCSCCPICLHNFKAGETLSIGRVCGHVYHEECLTIWLSKSSSCPYCRQDLEEKHGGSAKVHKTAQAWEIFDGMGFWFCTSWQLQIRLDLTTSYFESSSQLLKGTQVVSSGWGRWNLWMIIHM